MRILIAGTWDEGPGYPRTDALRRALVGLGHDVRQCRVDPPAEGRSRVALVSRPWRWPAYLRANRRTRSVLRAELQRAIGEFTPDAVLVPYPGHLAVRVVRDVFRGPVVLDLFLSAWSTAVVDRGMFPAWSPPARFLRHLDAAACEAADLVLLDTPEHTADVRSRTSLPADRFDWVPICDPAAPPWLESAGESSGSARTRVLFFGTGVPLHGLPVWIDAWVATPDVDVTLIGGDPRSRQRARDLLGDRLQLLGRFESMCRIRAEIDRADLVCGIVGTSSKARLVVPYKVVHALAHGRPVLTADSPAVRGLLAPGVDCLTVSAGDPGALQAAMLRFVGLGAAGRSRLRRAARARFDASFSLAAVSARLGPAFERVVSCPKPGSSVENLLQRPASARAPATSVTSITSAVPVR